jgi:hypothetical protein
MALDILMLHGIEHCTFDSHDHRQYGTLCRSGPCRGIDFVQAGLIE